ncbi:MAG TPA: hypothetical protein VGC49_03615 [Solirubrobacterales bacterium]|jgi:hypothetical protein
MRVRRSFRIFSAAIAIAATAVVSSGCGDLSRGELSRGVESLSALAAQGGLLADGVAADSTKSTYARVMAKTLGGEAEHEAEKLADATPSPEVERERDAAVRVAAELADLFSELQVFPGDEHRGALVQHRMHEVEEKADAIFTRLTGEEP